VYIYPNNVHQNVAFEKYILDVLLLKGWKIFVRHAEFFSCFQRLKQSIILLIAVEMW